MYQMFFCSFQLQIMVQLFTIEKATNERKVRLNLFFPFDFSYLDFNTSRLAFALFNYMGCDRVMCV